MSNFAENKYLMYRGFNLILKEEDFADKTYFKNIHEIGLGSASQQKIIIKEKLNSFVGRNGSLDGSKMQANWFPQIKADIFISHSHKDKKLALALAGWLQEAFGLTVFIDSCVWGYANDLLKMIDEKYCYQEETSTYNYQKRNYSTSHVHMMLSVALTQMIDNTECLFFLNTPKSITPNTIINKTESPWIYSEISISQLIRKKELQEYRIMEQNESLKTFSEDKKLNIQYDLPTDHLVDINGYVLREWEETWKDIGISNKYPQYSENLRVHALDKLYELTKQKNGQQ